MVNSLNLLQKISQLIEAINNEVDWYLLYSSENNPNHKEVYKRIFYNKCKKVNKLARKEVIRYGK